jgi:ribosomal protein S18 acetylase RimI-like enzyme
MTAPLLDLALSRRIELAEAQAAVSAAEALRRRRPESGTAAEPIAGGFAVYCGTNSPLTQAVGLGLDGPVSEEALEQLENFYRERNEPVRSETSPLADASLFEHFGKRGYRVTEFSNVMARSLTASPASKAVPAVANGIAIEKVPPEQVDLWTLTVAQGFVENVPVGQELLEIMRMFALAHNVECYLARVEGAVAGGGTLTLHDGIAGLFGASTLPAFRSRGVQTRLLQARMARAVEAGCDLAVCLAQPGSSSQRNVVRQGFSVLYTRVKFEKAWE